MTNPMPVSRLSDIPLVCRGKVRDVHDLGDRLLIRGGAILYCVGK